MPWRIDIYKARTSNRVSLIHTKTTLAHSSAYLRKSRIYVYLIVHCPQHIFFSAVAGHLIHLSRSNIYNAVIYQPI